MARTYLTPVTPKLLQKAALAIRGREGDLWNEVETQKRISETFRTWDKNTDIRLSLKQIELSRVLKNVSNDGKEFPCIFFKGRTGWLWRNKQGCYHYYSKKEKGTFIYRFDLFDLLSIFRAQPYRDIFRYLEAQGAASYITEWYQGQTEKYQENEAVIEKLHQHPERYPNLSKLCKKHWHVLSALNRYAWEQGVRIKEKKDEAIFFLSVDYLNQLIPESSRTVLNQVVNLFCLLGLTDKIPPQQIPSKMLARAERFKNERERHFVISFFSFPLLSQRLDNAEKQAAVWLKAGFKYYHISYQQILDVFGEEEASRVYLQKAYGRPRKNDPVYMTPTGRTYSEQERLERKFRQELQEKGRCEKRALKESTTLPQYRFEKYWRTLVEKYNCIEVFPTNQQMRAYGLSKRRLLAIPKQ